MEVGQTDQHSASRDVFNRLRSAFLSGGDGVELCIKENQGRNCWGETMVGLFRVHRVARSTA